MVEVESVEVEKTHSKMSRIVLVGACVLLIVGGFWNLVIQRYKGRPTVAADSDDRSAQSRFIRACTL